MISIPGAFLRPRPTASVVALAFVIALCISAPFTVDAGGVSTQQALAGRGGGNAGGHGGGNGNGHGHGRGGAAETAANLSAASDVAAPSKRPNGTGSMPTVNRRAHMAAARSGDPAMELGALNAAHASATAFANASEESVVGKLSAYMDAMATYVESLLDGSKAEQDAALQDAADHLADAANKDALIDPVTIDAVNELLDGKADGFAHEGIDGDPVHDAEPAIADLANPPSAD